MTKNRLIIAIDGPAGSGKSTAAKEIAKRLGLLYVDTGAMYRALTLKAVREKLGLNDEERLFDLVKRTKIDLKLGNDFKLTVLLDGEDVSEEIREPTITNSVKHVARISKIRKEMVTLQRNAASSGRAVLEGRDIGTIVFPDADKKIFLDADIDERVKRRYKELIEKGRNITSDEVKADVQTRDYTDEAREAGPLKKADDAIVIDTTDLSIEEVADKIIGKIKYSER